MGFLGNALATGRGEVDMNQNVNPNAFGMGTTNAALTDLSKADRAAGDATTAAMKPITDAMVGNQMGLSTTATDAAKRSFGDYQTMMGAVKSDAMNYDSPEQMARVRQEAAGNANAAFDTAQTSRDINLAHMGVNPNSGRFADPTAMGLQRAAGVSGSMNEATANRNNAAIGLRSNVAGMSGNAASAFSGVGLNAGKAAVDTGVTGNNAALPWMVAAGQPLATQAGLNASMYGTAVRDAGQTLDFNLGGQKIVSDQVGAWSKLAFSSSKTFKTAKRAIDESAVLAGLMRIPVEMWRYKKGIADEGEHIGPYAEDVHREFGESAAPGGKMIDLISMHGLAFAGLRALATKVAGLERARG